MIRGYNDTIVLSLLVQGDSYGYEISKAIDRLSGGNYQIKETTLYSTVNRLEKTGISRPTMGMKPLENGAPIIGLPARGCAITGENARNGN